MILFMGLSIHPQITSYQPYPIMKLYQLLQAYDFDELMPVINDMFPGTSKFRPELKHAYELLLSMQPVASKKSYSLQDITGRHCQSLVRWSRRYLFQCHVGGMFRKRRVS